MAKAAERSKLATTAILGGFAAAIADAAKEAIGTYEFGWPPLGPAAVAKHGDTPLLDTGALRTSISWHLLNDFEAEVGTPSMIGLYQEMGTSRGIPPRPFMGPSIDVAWYRIQPEVRKALRGIFAGAHGGAALHELEELIHVVKLAWHAVKDFADIAGDFSDDGERRRR